MKKMIALEKVVMIRTALMAMRIKKRTWMTTSTTMRSTRMSLTILITTRYLTRLKGGERSEPEKESHS